MNYRSCEIINKHFLVTEEGDVACPDAEMIVDNSLQRAYIFANLFFYDITAREVQKLAKKINDRKDGIVSSSGIPADEVERLFPALSSQFKMEIGDNSLDPLIKVELAKVNPHLSLQPTKDELKSLDKMYQAICDGEIHKFQKAVIFTEPQSKPYQVNFSEKYINALPPRAKRFLKPTIKMLAYMQGRQFATFNLSADYVLTYTWDESATPEFDEEKIKDEIKSVIASRPLDIV